MSDEELIEIRAKAQRFLDASGMPDFVIVICGVVVRLTDELAATRARLAEYDRVGDELIDMLDDLRIKGREVPQYWWRTTRALYALVHDMPAVGTGDEGGPT